ncbi:MAG TPA: hypothetical protein VIQ30_07640 [Pseudonocardia sp.]|jgi:hypothetical protein
MTASEHDAQWWQQFTVAPAELQRAMHSTLRAREALELRSRLGIDDDVKLAGYEQRLTELEQAEQRIRETLDRRRASTPIPRPRRPRNSDAATKAGSGAGGPAAPGPEHYW